MFLSLSLVYCKTSTEPDSMNFGGLKSNMMLKVAQCVFCSPLKAFCGHLSFQDVNICLQLGDSVAELQHHPVVFCSECSEAQVQKNSKTIEPLGKNGHNLSLKE